MTNVMRLEELAKTLPAMWREKAASAISELNQAEALIVLARINSSRPVSPAALDISVAPKRIIGKTSDGYIVYIGEGLVEQYHMANSRFILMALDASVNRIPKEEIKLLVELLGPDYQPDGELNAQRYQRLLELVEH